jgi:outer membrane receptor protein involved in Fe transport
MIVASYVPAPWWCTGFRLMVAVPLLGVLMAECRPVHAQVTEPGSGALEEVIVTARKREETIQSAPAAVFAVTPQDLANYGITDLVSAGDLVPGLQIARSTNNSAANIYLRGVGSSFSSISYDQAVATVIDNVPIGKGRVIFQSFTDMQQEEVLKGPQALYFGKNSTAGVISVKTADPGNSPEFLARGGYEYDGRTYSGEFVASGPVTDTLGVRLSMRASNMLGGYFTNIGPQLNGVARNTDTPQEKEYSGRLTVVYKPTDRLSLNIKFSADHLGNDGVNGYTQLVNCQGPGGTPQPVFGVPNMADGCKLDRHTSDVALAPAIAAHFPGAHDGQPWLRDDSVLTSATATYRWDHASLTSVTGYYRFNTNNFDNFDEGSASQVFGSEQADYSSLTQELRLASDFQGPLNFTAGLFFDSTRLNYLRPVRLFSFAPPDPTTGQTDDWASGGYTHGNTYSGFADIAWAVNDQIELSGGARYSKEHKFSVLGVPYVNANAAAFGLLFAPAPIADRFDDSNVSPSVTLRWRPTDRLTWFASYRTGYKSGGSNLSQIPFLGQTSSSIHFGSESAKGGEAGVKAELLDRSLWLGATVYRYTYSNLQVSLFDPVTISQHVANAGTYRTTGVELDSAYAPPPIKGMKLLSSLYYNHARYVDYVGPCYTGQTIAEGCNLVPDAGVFNGQNYAGRPGAHAPEWTAMLGTHYDVPLPGNRMALGFSLQARYTGAYFLQETLAPLQEQGGFVNLDASVRLYEPAHERWEIALIGRNLTNKLVGENAEDNTGSGSGTGSAVGTPADTVLITNAPIQVTLQLTARF